MATFFISSCSPIPSKTPPKQFTGILNTYETHTLLQKWATNDYQSFPDQKITFTSHHPIAKHFAEIKSGYSISRFTNRTIGIGLPSVIKSKTPTSANRSFTPITPDAFLTNLQPANIVATQTSSTSTHIDIYDPRVSKHKKQALAYQPKIVMDYLNDIPGNSSLDIMGLISPQKYSAFKGFYLAEPYNRNRIPVLMIHGLASSPETFMDMSEAINADPQLRKKYQLWYYFYPSGTPWIATASEFRKSYRTLIQKLDPNKNDVNLRKKILIAHSMGGLISRASLSHPGETLHRAYLGDTPLAEVFSQSELKRIDDYFHYKPLKEPAKVIYLATPHRGSRIADGFIGWLTIKIITIPTFIIQQTADVITLGTLSNSQLSKLPEHTQKLLTTGESSVDQLKPTNPSLIALNQMPIRKGLISHSIIGDIGMPLIQLKTDGVVSYHSAHIPYSKSEHIIPSDHGMCRDKYAIKAVLKILKK